MNKRKKVIDFAKRYESNSFTLLRRLFNRLLAGFFLFKKRKGENVAGSATFFIMLSFCPILLLAVDLSHYVLGDIEEAQSFVFNALNSNIPNLAPWILKSIKKIVISNVGLSAGFEFMNVIMLTYSLFGVIGAVVYGLNAVSKSESKGGFLIEDFRSLLFGAVVIIFIGTLVFISNKALLVNLVASKTGAEVTSLNKLFRYNILTPIVGIFFFTLIYKFAPTRKVSLKDSLLGAITFIICFGLGKSGHWVYLKHSRAELTQSYGDFYSMFLVIFWIFFIMCSFFYGASVAYVKYQDVYEDKLINEEEKRP